jgi:tetratricopeptide (TPR) repeat protein
MFAPLAFASWDLLVLPKAPRRWITIAVVSGATALSAIPVMIVASQSGIITETKVEHPTRIASILGAQGHYIQSLVLAKRPSIAYPIQVDGPSWIDLTIGGLAILATLALVWRWRRDRERHAWQLALLAWAWTWFLPIGHVFTRVHIFVADRYAYLWSIAGCVAIAWGLLALSQRLRLVAMATLTCVLAIANIRAQAAWTSSFELFSRAVASSPRDPAAYENLAIALTGDGRALEALDVLDVGLQIHPDHVYLLERKASILIALGRRDEALAATTRAAESGFSSAMWMHADLLHRMGRNAEAVVFAERATKRKPENEGYAATFAEILIAVHREREAEPVLRSLLALSPQRSSYHFLLAVVLVRTGRVAEAQAHIDAAAADPALADAVRTLRSEIKGP